jgi:hypothetical protein
VNCRREISHQKSPRRPEKFRVHLGLPDENVDGNSTTVWIFNWNRDGLLLENNEPEIMAFIKPQQPKSITVAYPAMRRLQPGYRQV